MIPTEEQRGTVAFDLEKARAVDIDLLAATDWGELRARYRAALAEIERLRADNAGLSKAVVDIGQERDLAQAEFRAYHQAWEEHAARIKELEDAHKRSGEKYAKIINELRSSVYANIPGLKKQWDEILNAPANGKIGPYAKPRSPQESDDLKHCHSCGKSIEEVKGNLCKGDYFIGSIFLDPGQEASRFDPPIDASYYFSCCDCARSWQITEERKAVILHCKRMLTFLKEDDVPCYDVEKITKDESVLVAMLTEAGQ